MQIDHVSVPYQQISETALTFMQQSNQRIRFPDELALRGKDFGLVEGASHPVSMQRYRREGYEQRRHIHTSTLTWS